MGKEQAEMFFSFWVRIPLTINIDLIFLSIFNHIFFGTVMSLCQFICFVTPNDFPILTFYDNKHIRRHRNWKGQIKLNASGASRKFLVLLSRIHVIFLNILLVIQKYLLVQHVFAQVHFVPTKFKMNRQKSLRTDKTPPLFFFLTRAPLHKTCNLFLR